MAQDPRGVWAALPRPPPRPRRRRPPGAGKAQKLGSSASSKTWWETVYLERDGLRCPNSSSERCQRSSPSSSSGLPASQDPPLPRALSPQCSPLLVTGTPRLGAPRRPPQPHHILQQQLQRQKGRVSVGGGDMSQTMGPRPQIGIEKEGEFRVMPRATRPSGSEYADSAGSSEGPIRGSEMQTEGLERRSQR